VSGLDDKKLKELDAKLDIAEKNILQEESLQNSSTSGFSSPWGVVIELIAGLGAGSFVGWHLDSYLSTKPLFFILGFLFGVAGGFYNVYKRTIADDRSEKNKNSDL
jgi:F0F1-type ATP synthase assembly protein I